MKRSNIIFAIIIGLLVFYIGNRCGDVWFQSAQSNVLDKFIEVLESIDGFFSDFKIAFDSKSLACGGLSLFFYFLAVLLVVFNRKNTMPGREYGSAEWGTVLNISKYKDKNPENNMILTKTESMSINTRQTMRNNNILVIGGSGTGKSRFFVKPNLLQLHTSYVVTDPNR